jgi:Ca2+/Na+ antiporter
MARSRIVNGLVSLLVAIALLLFVLLSGINFDLSLGAYVFLILLAVLIYLLFLIVFAKSNRKRVSEFEDFPRETIVEYKSPAMEEFDKEYKEAIERPSENSSEEEFVGTDESKMYHKKTCRFAKLIKPKYRVEGSKDFFKKKKFKACSVCKPNKG